MDLMRPSTPAALQAAQEREPRRRAVDWCSTLSTYGVGDERTWGFQIYRTVYTPGSDGDFAAALDVLAEYMRWDCFRNPDDEDEDGIDEHDHDDTPNQQIWQRMVNEVVEDATLLNQASPRVV